MAKGLRAACGAAALGMGLLGATGAVRADDLYDFSYISTFVKSGSPFSVSGMFSVANNNNSIYNISGNAIYGSNTSVIKASDVGFLRPGNQDVEFRFGSGLDGSIFSGSSQIGGSYQSANATGRVNGDPATINHGAFSTGLFTATLQNFLNPVSPGNGGGSTGSGSGGSGGSSSASGAAPSPEVNTLLGFLVVGGVVAFMKRKRRDVRTEGVATA